MKINLRKSNILQLAIQDALKGIKFTTDASINEFQDAELKISDLKAKFLADNQRHTALTESLYEIRKAVSQANHSVGVNIKLADIAICDKQIQTYTELASKAVRENAEVVAGKMNKIRNRKEDARSVYYSESTVDTSIFSVEDIAEFRAHVIRAKKEKQRLQDELLDINVRTEFTLSEQVVGTLTAEGLV